MSFRWDQRIPEERPPAERLSRWVYVVLFLAVEIAAVVIVLSDWPKGVSLASEKFVDDALLVPFPIWLALCFVVHMIVYDGPALVTAAHNRDRWFLITGWQRQARSGMAVLDSVILTPEPDLAERMLALEGEPPENPGKVMALADIGGPDDASRLPLLLDALLSPLAARLAKAAKSGSFGIVTQCDDEGVSGEVLAAWERLKLPGKPVVRSLDNSRNPGFADTWFKDEIQPAYPYASYNVDRTPKYRLVLAWHLNRGAPDVVHKDSEVAVALLLGSPALMQEQPGLKRQAWLLRQVTGEADQVDRSLALLLNAGQAPVERIRHFWHSGLKGLAQHATLGAVRESGLKVEIHALDTAIGPQAHVARWVLQALAARMAHFGQGPQLVALPHEQRVALNLVAKEPAPVDVPWKKEYGYAPVFGPESGTFVSIWTFAMLITPDKSWGGFETVITCVIAVCLIVCFIARNRYLISAVADRLLSYW